MIMGMQYGQFGEEWWESLTKAIPQVTQAVNAIRPLVTGTSRPTVVTVPVSPPPQPAKASMFSGNTGLLIGGGVAVLVLGGLLLAKRRR